MEMITSLAELEKAFNIKALSETKNYDEYFWMLAESLFCNFQIRNGNDVFRFVEIEFYLRATEAEDRKIAYDRVTAAGEWFLHDNGVDLSFESNVEFYGGILIRAMKQSKSYHEAGEFLNGPRKCSWYILDGLNAFGKNERCGRIEEAEIREDIELRTFTRHGIKGDDKQFRFTIPLDMWPKESGYKAYPDIKDIKK